jgi:hypothetical protein
MLYDPEGGSWFSKQQIRRALVRLFWKFEDILIDEPKAD